MLIAILIILIALSSSLNLVLSLMRCRVGKPGIMIRVLCWIYGVSAGVSIIICVKYLCMYYHGTEIMFLLTK